MNFKNIHIGELIHTKLKEDEIPMERVEQFMRCTTPEVKEMLLQENLSTEILLKWSKLLEYDFFRLYSQHLILFAPPKSVGFNKNEKQEKQKSALPQFRKHIYTKEIIDFVVGQIINHKKTKQEVMDEYNIPKTTLYKWLKKY
ncbi:transposase [Chryseobacterium sp. PMSZPI]|uniref:transposase n=1 Tax=Chryseobacterium sp. PMSZPI TaxID=1033900 RepID=UPI000C32EBC0|nr:transposase [Chryseobacterium sp. PMSZPI]PKF72472.1 transposase [Chryseobacterium sp. PMSZPI]